MIRLKAPCLFLKAVAPSLLVALSSIAGCATQTPAGAVMDEEWATVAMGGVRIGYIHTLSRQEASPPALVTNVFSESRLQRFGVGLAIRMSVEYRESPDGTLLSAASSTSGSGSEITSEARAVEDKMVITTRTPGNVHTVSIPWDNSILGPQAQTRMVRESGMEAGKEVQFKTFMPEFQKIASSTIKFGDMETLVLDGRPLALRRAAMTQDILPGLVTQAWLDEKGNVVRSYMDVLGGMETLRCTREQAMKAIRPDDAADVMGRFLVRSNETLSRPTEVTEAVYRIEAKADSLRRLQLEDRRQSVLERLADGIVLRVKALADADAPAAQQPGPEFLKSSPYLQRDDQDIVKAARKASGDAKTAQEKAFRLRAWVSKYVAQKDYDVAFASAKEVLLSREGDCTEHSVLLAALLRAEDIPSRVVVGVVYWKGNFAYHMWTEAFLNDWVAMDAMFAEDVADATHIKLADSALDTASASDPFLSVVEVVGKMKIGVQNAECRVQSAE